MEMLRSLLSVTAYSAVLLAAILLVRRFLSARLSPALQYALWFLLIARLLLPVSVESPLRLITLPERQAPVSAALPASVPAASPVVPEASGAVLPTPMPAAPAVIARPAANGLSAVSIHQIVYFSGAALCGGSFAVLYALLRRRIRKFGARPAQGLVQLTEETRRALGIRARIRPVCLDEPGSPALLFPATLLLPADLLASMDEAQIRLVLRHELTHFRRGDAWMNLLLVLLRSVYWFNPVIWLAAPLIRADMESACDASVIRRLTQPERTRYAALLLELFSRPAPRPLALSFAPFSTRKIAETRLRGILCPRRSSRAAKLCCAALALVLTVSCFTTACVPQRVSAPQDGTGAVPTATPLPEPVSVTSRTVLDPHTGRTLSFTVRDQGAEPGSANADALAPLLSVSEAAERAILSLLTCFGDAVSDGTAAVFFSGTLNTLPKTYSVSLTDDTADESFSCRLNAETGRILSVSRRVTLPEDDTAPVDWAQWEPAWEELVTAASDFVLARYGGERTVLADSHVTGLIGTNWKENPISGTVVLHMSQGECYILDMLYPGLAVEGIQFYESWEALQLEIQGGIAEPVDGELLTEARYQALADAARANAGAPLSLPAFAGSASAYARRAMDMLIDAALGARASDEANTALLLSPDDAALAAGRILRFDRGDPNAAVCGIYLGDGQYLYGDAETQSYAVGSLDDGWGSRFTRCFLSDLAVKTPFRAYPSAESAALYARLAEEAAQRAGTRVTERAAANRSPGYQLVRDMIGSDHALEDQDSVLEIWDAGDAALLPGKVLRFVPADAPAADNENTLWGICMGGARYLLLDPETQRVTERDLARDLADGRYRLVVCSIYYDPDGVYRTVALSAASGA